MLINCIRDRNHFFAVLLALPFFTVYIWSDQLVDGRYTAKTFYFYLISAIVFAGIALVLLFRKRPLQISFSKLDALIFIFYFYSFIRMLLTPNTTLNNTRFIIHSLLLGLYFAWKTMLASSGKTRGISPEKIVLLLLLMSGFGQIIYGLLQLYQIIPVPYNVGGFKVFGNFGNPSPYGSFLGPFLPLGLGAFLLIESEENIDRIIQYAGLITFMIGLLVLPAVRSRSAILGSSGGILLILAVKYHLIEKSRYVLNRIWKRSVFYLLIVAIVILGSIGMYRVKKASALGRLLQWKITAGMIADKPVFGHGYNTFGLYYHDYQASYFANGKGTQQEKMIAGNNKQAHNEYIEVLAELGGIGLFILLGIIGAIFREYLQKNHKDNKNGSIRTVLFSGLLAFLIISLFTFQLQILPSLVIFVFLISGIATVQRTNRKFILNTLPQRILSLGLLGLIAIFAFHQRNNFKAHKKWKTANLYSGMRSYDPAIKKFIRNCIRCCRIMAVFCSITAVHWPLTVCIKKPSRYCNERSAISMILTYICPWEIAIRRPVILRRLGI